MSLILFAHLRSFLITSACSGSIRFYRESIIGSTNFVGALLELSGFSCQSKLVQSKTDLTFELSLALTVASAGKAQRPRPNPASR